MEILASPKTLLEAIKFFSDEQTCIDTVARMRWPNGVRCPDRCPKENPYYLKTQKRWKCRECGRQFSVKVGTIFEDSPISLTKWLPALWLLTNSKNGVSSHELARSLGVTQKTAWFMLHRLRLVLKPRDLGKKLGGPDGGGVEVDESFLGGKVKNMHRSRANSLHIKKAEMGSSYGIRIDNKATVLGMFDRESREVRAKVVPNVKRETLQNEILNNIKYGSAVYTDQAVAYDNLGLRYVHETVNHTDTYVRGQVHTNSLENFWSLMKRNLSGTYVAVEPFHLDRYLDEQVFRFNNRGSKEKPISDADRFRMALSQVSRRRLTYSELTGKVGERAED